MQVFNKDLLVFIKATDGVTLKVVENFKYLGGWTDRSEKGIEVSQKVAWSARNKTKKRWKSDLSTKIKSNQQ